MSITKKITKKEYDRFVDSQLYSRNWSKPMRDAARAAFIGDLEDVDFGERQTFFNNVVPGITEEEMKKRMTELRDPNSALSKGLKYPLYEDTDKLNELEGLLKEALEGNKEPGILGF